MKKVKVLIIDDSALTRSILKELIGSDKRIEIVGTAFDPVMALEKIPILKPDVLTLDLVMPKMDGITFLKKISQENPIPTVIISGNSPKDSSNAIQALENGAIEIIQKPDISSDEKYNEVKRTICEAIIAASLSRKASNNLNSLNHSFRKTIEPPKSQSTPSTKFYVIGASTGGPKLLKDMFAQIKCSVKRGFIIAQHMPAGFTKSFAESMNAESNLTVVESGQHEMIEDGKVIVIPGDLHGLVQKNDTSYFVELASTEKVNRHRPSVDVLFESAAKNAGSVASGILLTGMGDDGARGLKILKDKGSKTIVQNESTSVVYGMPKVAKQLGAAQYELSPSEIVQMINEEGE